MENKFNNIANFYKDYSTKKFYDNQINTTKILYNNIVHKKKYYQMLVAEMQSGKSGTYFLLALEILKNDHIIKNVLIISGNSEIELRTQCFNDKEYYINIYEKYVEKDYPTISLRENIINKFKKNITIKYGRNLKDFDVENNTLIIWDESHYAQTKGQGPDKFRSKNGIDLNGVNENNKKKNIYIVSVSATPFSEISDHLNNKNAQNKSDKELVYLNPGNDYRGVKYYFDNDKIKFINKRNKIDELDRIMSIWMSKNKYNIIRCTTDIILEQVKNKANNYGYEIINFFADSKEINSLDELKNEPLKPTIVIIKNMCRMGKVVPKKYIGFVFELSDNPKTDTILQGLLGRMCGYDFQGNDEIEIYISSNSKKEIKTAITLYDNLRSGIIQDMPKKAMNLVNNNNNIVIKKFDDGSSAYPSIPIYIPFKKSFAEDGEYDNDEYYNIVNRYLNNQKNIDDMIINGYIKEQLVELKEKWIDIDKHNTVKTVYNGHFILVIFLETLRIYLDKIYKFPL